MNNLKKIISALIVLTFLLNTSCKEEIEHIVTFHLAESENSANTSLMKMYKPITMPKSGMTLYMNTNAIMSSLEVAKVEHIKVPNASATSQKDAYLDGFQFHLRSRGPQLLDFHSTSNINRAYIIAFLDNKPIAVRPIDMSIKNGILGMYSEMPDDTSYEEIVNEINESMMQTMQTLR